MSGKTAAIIGVTGMVGSEILSLLLDDPYFETVRLLVRRPYPSDDPKIEVKLVDFQDAESFKLALEGVDTIFSCIGTTQKNVKGNNELYRKIDFDIPVNAAKFGKELNCDKFIMVSSVGANSKSGTFYLKLKGEIEEAIEQTGIYSIHFMQPSLLLGRRKEKRSGEKIMQGTMSFFNIFLFGSWKKYRAIPGVAVAKAMVIASKKQSRGVFGYEYEALRQLSNN